VAAGSVISSAHYCVLNHANVVCGCCRFSSYSSYCGLIRQMRVLSTWNRVVNFPSDMVKSREQSHYCCLDERPSYQEVGPRCCRPAAGGGGLVMIDVSPRRTATCRWITGY
jgi:hypothetical protein